MERRERATMREKRLYEVSLSGDVDSMNELLRDDQLLLARASLTCFDETPLHVASMLGHVELAAALLAHRRDLAGELDSEGRLPLHVASANGFVDIVRLLLASDPDGSSCLVRDGDGRTPLHVAAMKGRVEVVRELARARPEVVGWRFDRGTTVLHACVGCNRLEALRLLVELGGGGEFVNSRDDGGNTVFHTAVALKQMETVRYLLHETTANVNMVNGNGFTPLDIIENMPRDFKSLQISEMLIHARAQRSTTINSPPPPPITLLYQRPPPPLPPSPPRNRQSKHKQDHQSWLNKKRESLLVAATVIAAMAFQAGINPPGGVWQGNDLVLINNKNVTVTAGTSVMAFNYRYRYNGICELSLFLPNNTCDSYHLYPIFWACNTIAFLSSLCVIVLLVSGLPLRWRIWMWLLMVGLYVTITFTALTYMISVRVVSPQDDWGSVAHVMGISVVSWVGLTFFVLLVHTGRLILRVIKGIFKIVWKCMRPRARNIDGGRYNI